MHSLVALYGNSLVYSHFFNTHRLLARITRFNGVTLLPQLPFSTSSVPVTHIVPPTSPLPVPYFLNGRCCAGCRRGAGLRSCPLLTPCLRFDWGLPLPHGATQLKSHYTHYKRAATVIHMEKQQGLRERWGKGSAVILFGFSVLIKTLTAYVHNIDTTST